MDKISCDIIGSKIAVHDNDYHKILLDNVSVGMLIVQLLYSDQGEPIDYLFLDVNSAYVKFIGFAKKEILGKKATDFNSSIEPEWFIKYGEIVKTGKTDRFEMFNEHHGCWFDVLAIPLGEQDKFAIIYTDITEHKKSERALRKSEEKYRTLFESIDEGFVILEFINDEDGNLVDMRLVEGNQVYKSIFGHENLPVKLLREIVPDFESDWYEPYDKAKRTGQPVQLDKHSYTNGRWYNTQVSHMGPPDSHRFSLIFKDITESKLKAQKQSFLLELSDILHSTSDSKTIQATATKLLVEHLGVSQSSYTEYNEESLIIDTETSDSTLRMKGMYERSNFSEGIDIILSGRDVICSDVLEYSGFSKEQRDYIISLNIRADIAIPIFNDGNLVASLSVRSTVPRVWSDYEVELVREVAERTWIAVERAKAEEALKESENRYHMLFEATNDGFWWSDKHGYVIDANGGLPKMLGYDKGELVGRFWTDFVDDEWLDKGNIEWEARKSGKSNRYEIKLKKKDKSSIWAQINGLSVMDENGEYTGTLAAFKDITEQKNAENALRKSEEKFRALFDNTVYAFMLEEPLFDENGNCD